MTSPILRKSDFALGLTLLALILANSRAGPVLARTRSVATSLPLSCSGSPIPSICVYGYAYWDSAPVTGASVQIDSPYGTLHTTTASGTASSSPYFQANLSGAPLLVSAGGTITITATYNGSSASNSYVVAAGGQQVDVYIPASALFGNGMDGDLTVSTNVDLNPVRASASGTVSSTLLSISGVTGSGFQANQLVMIHQTRGTGAGAWELRTIQSAAAGQLTLTAPLSNTYTTDSGANRAQVIWVPQYRDLTVSSGVAVSPSPWDGNTGGILALDASGVVSIAGTLSVVGTGYRGGSRRGDWANNGEGTYADQGEGTAGLGIPIGSMSANANGGGGGRCHEGLGAWPSAGAGGGHASSGADGGSGYYGSAAGGLAAGDAVDLGSAVLGGGGGGGGDTSGAGAGTGGKGGGLIFISARVVNVTGVIDASGSNGTDGIGASGGGGGAGGAVLIRSQTVTAGTSLIMADGGLGGLGGGGPTGGAGSAGRVRIEYAATLLGSTTPPASAQHIAFPANSIPTVNAIYPTVAHQVPGEVITFRGQAGVADLSGATIASYVWRSDIDNLLSTQATFNRTASSLSAGTHTIFLKVKDSNNNWSDEVSRQLTVVPGSLYLPLIRK